MEFCPSLSLSRSRSESARACRYLTRLSSATVTTDSLPRLPMLNITLGQPAASQSDVADLTHFYWLVAICLLLYLGFRRGDPEVCSRQITSMLYLTHTVGSPTYCWILLALPILLQCYTLSLGCQGYDRGGMRQSSLFHLLASFG